MTDKSTEAGKSPDERISLYQKCLEAIENLFYCHLESKDLTNADLVNFLKSEIKKHNKNKKDAMELAVYGHLWILAKEIGVEDAGEWFMNNAHKELTKTEAEANKKVQGQQ